MAVHHTTFSHGFLYKQNRMQHPEVPTHHLDAVPRELSAKLLQHSDLTYQFSPRFSGLLGKNLEATLQRVFHQQIEPSPFLTAQQHQDLLMDGALESVAREQQHSLYVIQFNSPNPEGFVCLIPKAKEQDFLEVLPTPHLIRSGV